MGNLTRETLAATTRAMMLAPGKLEAPMLWKETGLAVGAKGWLAAGLAAAGEAAPGWLGAAAAAAAAALAVAAA